MFNVQMRAYLMETDLGAQQESWPPDLTHQTHKLNGLRLSKTVSVNEKKPFK